MSNGGLVGTFNSGIWDTNDLLFERDKIRKGMLPREGDHNKSLRYVYEGRRKFEDTMVSLMHFNYPYYSEPGDGMRDEVGILEWSAVGNAKFVGVEAPVAQSVAGTPKFGWRCLQTEVETDYIVAVENTNKLNINKSRQMEVEMFVRRINATTGNLMTLYKNDIKVFSIILSPESIQVVANGVDVSTTSSTVLNTWSHLLVKFYGGFCQIWLDGELLVNSSITKGFIEADEIRLGGFAGQIDEFRMNMKTTSAAPIVPTHPYQGTIPIETLGGFGDGSYGDIIIRDANTDINTTAIIQNSDQRYLTLGTRATGIYGDFIQGDRVMIHVSLNKTPERSEDLGKFSIRNIESITNNDITLDKPIDEFILDQTEFNNYYYYQIIKIPQFNSFRIVEGASIVPKAWNNTTGGGFVALTVLNDCIIEGNITTVDKGISLIRTDNKIFCHDQMQDELLLTGNIFLLCGNILTISSGYLGGTWDGSIKGGARAATVSGSGYGGGGGYGGGAGGGGSTSSGYPGTAGYIFNGGKGGINGNSSPVSTPGRYNKGHSSNSPCGSTIFIIGNKLLIDKSKISHGGAGGNYRYGHGGATGFCYMAFNEMIEDENVTITPLNSFEPIRYAQDKLEI